MEYLKDKNTEPETNCMNKRVQRYVYRHKQGYQHKTNSEKDENADLLPDPIITINPTQ